MAISVVGLRLHSQRPLAPDQVQLLAALDTLVAGALERIALSEKVGQKPAKEA